MSDSGHHPSVRSSTQKVVISLSAGLLAVAVLPVSGAPGGVADTPFPPAPAQSSRAVRPQAHPVAPQIHNLVVPAVPSSYRPDAATAGRLPSGSDAPVLATPKAITRQRGQLVAHLRAARTADFTMVALTWAHGTGSDQLTALVRFRRHSAWSAWSALRAEPEEGPSSAEDTVARDGTGVLWSGEATGVEARVYSPTGLAPRALRLNAIDPGTSAYDAAIVRPAATGTPDTPAVTATAPAAESARTSTAPDESKVSLDGTRPVIPRIITRKQWGADPRLADACWSPRYGRTYKMVFVHHTAGVNGYSEAESAAIVRGVYAYHTQSRGWCDIGYNFLVDRYGNVFEGRRGGIRLPVRGAHSGDYNVDTTGISLMGNFEVGYTTRAMRYALVQLIAWRMGAAYNGAYGRPTVSGKRFMRISGHRDAMSTSCPGQHVYDWLPTLRRDVATRLGDYESRIEAAWRAQGGAAGPLGAVHVGEQAVGSGRVTAFTGGRIYGSRTGLRTFFPGPILDKFRAIGGVRSALGYPTTEVYETQTGARARFEHGSISWDAATNKTTVTYA